MKEKFDEVLKLQEAEMRKIECPSCGSIDIKQEDSMLETYTNGLGIYVEGSIDYVCEECESQFIMEVEGDCLLLHRRIRA
jgi:DNA-directed RNA polymerase subunit RPC12/RpoP